MDRGVAVRALIAHTNKGGADRLRKLEQRMLEHGVTVDRTNDDLVRYHGKLMTIDRRRAYILGFNDTKADIKNWSFGVVLQSRRIVKRSDDYSKAMPTEQISFRVFATLSSVPNGKKRRNEKH